MASQRELQNNSNEYNDNEMNDYEIVFDHLNEDSIPDHQSYDMDEQPTVVFVDDDTPQKMNRQ